MKIINLKNKIYLEELKETARKSFGNIVKAVVDIERKIMVIDGELHSDEETLLLGKGSKQADLWGINLYPDLNGDEMVEFNSMINLRPGQKNLSRKVENPKIREEILRVVKKLIS